MRSTSYFLSALLLALLMQNDAIAGEIPPNVIRLFSECNLIFTTVLMLVSFVITISALTRGAVQEGIPFIIATIPFALAFGFFGWALYNIINFYFLFTFGYLLP